MDCAENRDAIGFLGVFCYSRSDILELLRGTSKRSELFCICYQ